MTGEREQDKDVDLPDSNLRERETPEPTSHPANTGRKPQSGTDSPSLEPLPYHAALRDYLKREEPSVWEWYVADKTQADQAEAVRFDLLKSTFRIERDDGERFYAAAETAAQRLGLDVPITIYQAQQPSQLNAMLAFIPREAHIVFDGDVAARLNDAELRALLGHELSHLLLWDNWDGEFLVADQILAALTNDQHAAPVHFATARLFSLYTEVFCDRGAMCVEADPLTAISMLVKLHTDAESVSAESYLRQAEEIYADQDVSTSQASHPEAFIRARALQLWSDLGEQANIEIERMIEGQPALDELDFLGQLRVQEITRQVIDRLLSYEWMQTEVVLSHARLYFNEFAAPTAAPDDVSPVQLAALHKTMTDYYCYVLLDFASADRELEELPLAAALTVAEELGLHAHFAEIARKELRMRKKQFESLDQRKTDLLSQA